MSDYATISTGDAYVGPVPAAAESRVSAVSWAAIAAGAFANLAISAVLLMVVAGLGLTEISPIRRRAYPRRRSSSPRVSRRSSSNGSPRPWAVS